MQTDKKLFSALARSAGVSNNAPNVWQPIPDLRRADADVSVVFLSQNSMKYLQPVDDPFFGAHRRNEESGTVTYAADEITTVMGCAEQYQLRNPVNNRVSEFTSATLLKNSRANLTLSPIQIATFDRLVAGSVSSHLEFSVAAIGTEMLKARDRIYEDLVALSMPPNQWQEELKLWFSTSLARLQGEVLSFVVKDIDGLAPYAAPSEPTWISSFEAVCNNQIIRNMGGYQSFSMLGIILIIVLGVIIVITSLCIDSAVGLLRRRFGWQVYKETDWRLDFMLQQQRLAFESGNQAVWVGQDETIPVTEHSTPLQRVRRKWSDQ